MPPIEDMISSLLKNDGLCSSIISDVLVCLDDILVAGSSEAEHMQILERAVAKLGNAGIRLKRSYMSLHVAFHPVHWESAQQRTRSTTYWMYLYLTISLKNIRSFLGLVEYYIGSWLILWPLHCKQWCHFRMGRGGKPPCMGLD